MSAVRTLSNLKVAIVGAGAAGLACSCRLLSLGLTPSNLHVYEAQERIGGRIFTKRDPAKGSLIEIGAQWIHGQEENVVYTMANRNNCVAFDPSLESSGLGPNVEILDEDGSIVLPELWEKMFEIMEKIEKESYEDLKGFDGSLDQYFRLKLDECIGAGELNDLSEDLREKLFDWHHRFENIIDAADDWSQTGGWGHTEYWLCPGDPLVVWNDGYETLFRLLLEEIPADKRPSSISTLPGLHFNKPVHKIEYSPGDSMPVKLSLDDGTSQSFNSVVFTGSLGVLKANGRNIFSPALPIKKQNAIEYLDLGTVDKIFLEFEDCWWPKDLGGFGFLRSDTEKFSPDKHAKDWIRDILGFYTVRKNPNMLVGWIFGAAARSMEILPEEQVLEDCYQCLKKYLGTRYTIPKPTKIIRSTWYSNPYTRGSYSYRTVLADKNQVWAKDLAEPIVDQGGFPILMFAGEATHDHFYSTVHGAVESGWREAERLIGAIRTSNL
ncbi:peroxisomal N(1)-acetyl-spermine/spermidine oxidase-like [Artemia franciscana]